jgi:hypothetical protein
MQSNELGWGRELLWRFMWKLSVGGTGSIQALNPRDRLRWLSLAFGPADTIWACWFLRSTQEWFAAERRGVFL